MIRTLKHAALIAALAAPAFAAAQQPKMVPANDQALVAGNMAAVVINGFNHPTYSPANRFTRMGNTFVVEMEYASDFFGPTRPDFWDLPIPLGELPPGNYTIQARMHDIASAAGTPPAVFETPFAVTTGNAMSVKPLPSSPAAGRGYEAVISSTYYFNPATVRVSREGDVARVDYQYEPAYPVGGSNPPAGYVSWTTVSMPPLPAGDYWLYSIGTPAGAINPNFLITYQAMNVRTSVDAIEYYSAGSDRYFVTSTPAEIAMLDGASSGWQRTGQSFPVWNEAGSAPSGSAGVCRFYAPTLGAHYHTPNPAECQWLRQLEAQERAQGGTFQGWAYEGVAFYVQVPVDGACPAGTTTVNRSRSDANRRYAADPRIYGTMVSWTPEGAVFCAPA